MRFSFKKRKITPDFPFVMQGFAARTKPREGIHDDLYATAAVLRANETLALISLDVIYADRAFGDFVRTEAAKRYGLDPDAVLVSYTHTHGALRPKLEKPPESAASATPEAAAAFELLYGYALRLAETVVSLVGECIGDLTEGEMYIAKGSSDFGISRRLPVPGGGIEFKPCDDPERSDPDLFVLTFADKNQTTRGIIYSCACHPTSCGSDNLLVTADYPGAVRRHLAKSYPEASAMFLQGCGADIKPRMSVKDGRFFGMTPEAMTGGAKTLADDVAALIKDASLRKITPDFKFAAEDIVLPCEKWTREKWESIASDPKEPEYRRVSARTAIKKLDGGLLTDGLTFRVHCVALSRDTRIIALENEVVNEYGRLIKARLPGETLTLGYTNSARCYIPTRRVLREGGYECDTFLNAGTGGPFTGETEDVIVGAAVKLAETMYKTEGNV